MNRCSLLVRALLVVTLRVVLLLLLLVLVVCRICLLHLEQWLHEVVVGDLLLLHLLLKLEHVHLLVLQLISWVGIVVKAAD